MRTQMMGLALAATALTVLAGCSSTGAGHSTADTDAAGASADSGLGSPSKTPSSATATTTTSATGSKTSSGTTSGTKKTTAATQATTTTAPGPEIAYFFVAQKPRCAEGTDKYQNPAVPLIIKWKIKHADSGALSVDDHTHTPGTYGQVGLSGSQDFGFSCAGAVGSTETHTYTIYSVGGGTQRSRTLTVTTKVLDKGTTVS
jgi:hypothetical protein